MFRITIACLCIYFFQSQCLFSQQPYSLESIAKMAEEKLRVKEAEQRLEIERRLNAEHPFSSLTIFIKYSNLPHVKRSEHVPDSTDANTLSLIYSLGGDGELFSLNRMRSPPPGKIPKETTYEQLGKVVRASGKVRDHCFVYLTIRDQNDVPSDLDTLAKTIKNLEELQDAIAEFENFQLIVRLEKKSTSRTDPHSAKDKEQ